MVKKFAGPGIALLLSVGFTILGWTSPVLGTILIGLAALWALMVVPPVAQRLPHLAVERGSRADGIAVRIRPPEAQGVKKLRKETDSLVHDIHEFLRSSEPPWADVIIGTRATHRAMAAAETEEETNHLWDQSIQELLERSARERQQLAALFGDRLRYVLHEYRQRGMISDSDARHIEWEAQSIGWLHEAATALGALSKRL